MLRTRLGLAVWLGSISVGCYSTAPTGSFSPTAGDATGDDTTDATTLTDASPTTSDTSATDSATNDDALDSTAPTDAATDGLPIPDTTPGETSVTPLLERRFGGMTGGAFTPPTGVTWTGPNPYTVQVGPSAVSVVSLETPAVFSNGTVTGLQIEESRTNALTYSRSVTGGLWVTGSATETSTLVAGVDGTMVTLPRLSCGIGQYSNYHPMSAPITGVVRFSSWVSSPASSGNYQVAVDDGAAPSSTVSVSGTTATSWARVIAPKLVVTAKTPNAHPCVGYAAGGAAAETTDSVHDLMQFEVGGFATSAIITTGAPATRAPTVWQEALATASAAGRVEIYLKLFPLGDAAAYTGTPTLLAAGGTSLVFNAAAGTVTCSDGSHTSTSSTVSFKAFDALELKVSVGAGPCIVDARVNATGGANVLTSTASFAALPTTGPVSVLSDGTASVFSAIVDSIVFYPPGAMPTGWNL
jgi:hypothetical protein